MMKAVINTCFVALAAATLVGVNERSATAAVRKSNVITLDTIQIVGRVQKPIESVDVGFIQPKLALSELQKTFLDEVEKAVQRDPF
jgi:hypothetical protein